MGMASKPGGVERIYRHHAYLPPLPHLLPRYHHAIYHTLHLLPRNATHHRHTAHSSATTRSPFSYPAAPHHVLLPLHYAAWLPGAAEDCPFALPQPHQRVAGTSTAPAPLTGVSIHLPPSPVRAWAVCAGAAGAARTHTRISFLLSRLPLGHSIANVLPYLVERRACALHRWLQPHYHTHHLCLFHSSCPPHLWVHPLPFLHPTPTPTPPHPPARLPRGIGYLRAARTRVRARAACRARALVRGGRDAAGMYGGRTLTLPTHYHPTPSARRRRAGNDARQQDDARTYQQRNARLRARAAVLARCTCILPCLLPATLFAAPFDLERHAAACMVCCAHYRGARRARQPRVILAMPLMRCCTGDRQSSGEENIVLPRGFGRLALTMVISYSLLPGVPLRVGLPGVAPRRLPPVRMVRRHYTRTPPTSRPACLQLPFYYPRHTFHP